VRTVHDNGNPIGTFCSQAKFVMKMVLITCYVVEYAMWM
jgi:hypothetical protein